MAMSCSPNDASTASTSHMLVKGEYSSQLFPSCRELNTSISSYTTMVVNASVWAYCSPCGSP